MTVEIPFLKAFHDLILRRSIFCECVFMQVLRCSKIASVKVSEITELINKALENDKKVRYELPPPAYSNR